MRACTALARLACVAATLIAGVAAAQQSSLFTPLSVEEPRTLPPAATIEARPLAPTYPPPPFGAETRAPSARRPPPPVNVRLVSAEQSVPSASEKPPLRLAPRSESGRPPLREVPKSTAASPEKAIATVAGSLGAVLGLFFIIAWCTRRFAPAGSAILPKEAVELLGRAPLATRQQMQLVRIGNKLLLVALSPVGVETLTEITEPAEVEHLTALCRRGRPGTSSAAFSQALAQISNEPAPRGFVGPSRPAARGAR